MRQDHRHFVRVQGDTAPEISIREYLKIVWVCGNGWLADFISRWRAIGLGKNQIRVNRQLRDSAGHGTKGVGDDYRIAAGSGELNIGERQAAVGRVGQDSGPVAPLIMQWRLAVCGNGKGCVFASPVEYRSEERRVGKEGRSRWSPYH